MPGMVTVAMTRRISAITIKITKIITSGTAMNSAIGVNIGALNIVHTKIGIGLRRSNGERTGAGVTSTQNITTTTMIATTAANLQFCPP